MQTIPPLPFDVFFQEKKRDLILSLLTHTPNKILKERCITNAKIRRPSLALAGFTGRFAEHALQTLGRTEIAYMKSLSEEQLRENLVNLFNFTSVPGYFVTCGLVPPSIFLELAEHAKIPVFQTRILTHSFLEQLSSYLKLHFAPRQTLHGTLVDIYGVGILLTGKSGIGKSECALDLVERGHRLVADDVVQVYRKGEDVLMGTASEMLGHHMEIRGVGIINVQSMFGVEAIRIQKRIEVAVELVPWSENIEFDRLGIEQKTISFLETDVPKVEIPVTPGKNLTVIIEAISLNHMLRVYGQDAAKDFNRRLMEELARKKRVQKYLLDDME